MLRILIDNSGYQLTNFGDVAMLQVAVERVAALWPDAIIEVITADEEHLKLLVPKATPLVIGTLSKYYSVRAIASEQIDWIAGHLRLTKKRLIKYFPAIQSKNHQRQWKGYRDAVQRVDLVLASGGGYINDTFVEHGLGVLDTLYEGVLNNKPTAIMSNGFEPLSNPAILERAKNVLPKLTLVACREKKFSPPVLQALGVSPECVTITGDDAVELGFNVRPDDLGNGIGVNLRVAWYSGVSKTIINSIRSTLHSVAAQHNAQLIPAPISMRSPADADSIVELMAGYGEVSDGGQNLASPMDVIKNIGKCRVIVTGSYHAGVFALSQGISVICIAQSEYYIKKFEGLQAQFGEGCYILSASSKNFTEEFQVMLGQAWDQAPEYRSGLLQAALQQIDLSKVAYQRLYNHVMERI